MPMLIEIFKRFFDRFYHLIPHLTPINLELMLVIEKHRRKL